MCRPRPARSAVDGGSGVRRRTGRPGWSGAGDLVAPAHPQVDAPARQAPSGGQAVEQTTHVFDLARLFGPARRVYAAGITGLIPPDGVRNIEDASAATIEFESGVVAVIPSACSLQAGHGVPAGPGRVLHQRQPARPAAEVAHAEQGRGRHHLDEPDQLRGGHAGAGGLSGRGRGQGPRCAAASAHPCRRRASGRCDRRLSVPWGGTWRSGRATPVPVLQEARPPGRRRSADRMPDTRREGQRAPARWRRSPAPSTGAGGHTPSGRRRLPRAAFTALTSRF